MHSLTASTCVSACLPAPSPEIHARVPPPRKVLRGSGGGGGGGGGGSQARLLCPPPPCTCLTASTFMLATAIRSVPTASCSSDCGRGAVRALMETGASCWHSLDKASLADLKLRGASDETSPRWYMIDTQKGSCTPWSARDRRRTPAAEHAGSQNTHPVDSTAEARDHVVAVVRKGAV
jgi:hypothetical protein